MPPKKTLKELSTPSTTRDPNTGQLETDESKFSGTRQSDNSQPGTLNPELNEVQS
jgi:hypothetical protein